MKLGQLIARQHTRGDAVELLSERGWKRQRGVSELNPLGGEHSHHGPSHIGVAVKAGCCNRQVDVRRFELIDHVCEAKGRNSQLPDRGGEVPFGEMRDATAEEPLVEIEIRCRQSGACGEERRHQPDQWDSQGLFSSP